MSKALNKVRKSEWCCGHETLCEAAYHNSPESSEGAPCKVLVLEEAVQSISCDEGMDVSRARCYEKDKARCG